MCLGEKMYPAKMNQNNEPCSLAILFINQCYLVMAVKFYHDIQVNLM